MLDSIEFNICDMQGMLFELSAKRGYDSKDFIEKFMKSDTAADLDKLFNHMQWAGEAYILSRVAEEDKPNKSNNLIDNEILYWIG